MPDRFDDWQQPEIEDGVPTQWGWMVSHPENLKLDRNTDIGAFTYIGAHVGVDIREYVQIGAGCKIYSLSTIDGKRGAVLINEGARIGANSVILTGVILGEYSLVGALSLVQHGTRIPPKEMWAGIPAKKIGDIADADTIF